MNLNVDIKARNRDFHGQIALSTNDAYGNILVIDYKNYRALSFDSIFEQSSYSLEKPYAVVHEYIRIMMLVVGFITPKHVTLLGLGGGSILRSLHYFLPQCHFQVVELRPKVYEIAQYYFCIPNDKRVQVSISDAKLHLKTMNEASSHIIFSDLYDAYLMSPIQVQKRFVEECWRVLSKDGWLVINFHQLPHINSIFFNALIDQFPTIFLCPANGGNCILFACKSNKIQTNNARAIAQQLEDELATPFIPLFNLLEKALP